MQVGRRGIRFWIRSPDLDFSQRNAPYYVTYYSIELVFDKFLFSPGFHVFPFLKGQFDNRCKRCTVCIISSHFATPRKPQPPTFWVEPATQKPADNPGLNSMYIVEYYLACDLFFD